MRSTPDPLMQRLVAMVRVGSSSGAAALQLSRDAVGKVPPRSAGPLVELARRHGVEAWLAAVAPDSWPPQVVAELGRQRLGFTAERARQRSVLQALASAFDDEVPWALLKGFSITEAVYPRPDLRASVDVDILVAPRAMAGALEAAESSGLELVDRNWPLLHRLQVGQLRLRAPNGVLVDLHWHPLNARAARRRFHLATGALLAGASERSGVRLLDDVDQLVHVLLHGALGGGNRLVWLVDVDQIVRRTQVDWGRVVAKAVSARAGACAALVLGRSRRWLGTPVPRHVLSELAGPLWPTVCAVVDRRRTLPTDPTAPALPRALARASGATARDSLVRLGVHGLSHLASRGRPDAPWLDVDDPRSTLHDVPGTAERSAYLDSVAIQP